MALTRKTVRQQTAVLLGAAVLPGTTTKVLRAVFEAVPDEIVNEDMPAAVIRVGDTRETRLTAPAGYGLKRIEMDVILDLFVWVDANDDLLGQRYMDDCLDGIDQTLRAAPATLTGSVAIAYETVSTRIHEPVNSIQEGDPAGLLLLHATRTFSASAYDGG